MTIRCTVLLPLLVACIVSFAPSTTSAADETVVHGEHGKHLDDVFKQYETQGFSGTVLIAKDGEILLAKGYGMADRENNVPNDVDTVFTFGSITKQFTGAAILQLEMEGKLSVDDRISEYLGKMPRDKRKITIHDLLTHTSGVRDGFGPDFSPMSREKIIERFKAGTLKFDVGEQHYYSNAGYSLLGAIIEVVSGQSYDEYMKENIYRPAGLMDTGYLVEDRAPDRLAQGYTGDGERWGTIAERAWAEDGPYWNLRANGGVLSTVYDMYRWHQALLGEDILSAEAKEKYFARHVQEEPGTNWYYGYGWAIATTERDTTLITHSGGNGIFSADFRRYVDDGVTIIYASNCAPLMTVEMEHGIRGHTFLYPDCDE